MGKIKRLFDVPEESKDCKWLKILGLDMSGNHQMMCRQPHNEDQCPCSRFEQTKGE